MRQKVYLTIKSSAYGQEFVVFGAKKRALQYLETRMNELMKKNDIDTVAQQKHKNHLFSHNEYDLPLGEEQCWEHGYILTQKIK